MPILVKSDDVRSQRKAKAGYGWHRRQWVKIARGRMYYWAIMLPKQFVLESLLIGIWDTNVTCLTVFSFNYLPPGSKIILIYYVDTNVLWKARWPHG